MGLRKVPQTIKTVVCDTGKWQFQGLASKLPFSLCAWEKSRVAGGRNRGSLISVPLALRVLLILLVLASCIDLRRRFSATQYIQSTSLRNAHC